MKIGFIFISLMLGSTSVGAPAPFTPNYLFICCYELCSRPKLPADSIY